MANLPTPLTPTSRRAEAAAVIRRATLPVLPPVSAMLVAEILDGTAAAVLRAAGCTDEAARAALAALWGQR